MDIRKWTALGVAAFACTGWAESALLRIGYPQAKGLR